MTVAILPNQETIKSELRKRHKLADDAPVGVAWRPGTIGTNDDEPHNPYAFVARINTDSIDRDYEVVLPEGVDLRNFDKSGAGFFNHDYSRPPIFVPGPVKMMGTSLVAKGTFLKSQLAEDVRDFCKAMADAGKAAGVSIGFRPTGSREPTGKDMERWGGAIRRVFTSWELLEWSIAPVQSNPEAVVMEVGKSLRAGIAKSLYGLEAPPSIEPVKRRLYVLPSPSVVPLKLSAPPVKARRFNTASAVEIATARAMARAKGELYV